MLFKFWKTSLSDLKSNPLPSLFIVGWNWMEGGCNLYVTLITSAHHHSLTLFVYKSDSMHSLASSCCTTTLPSHQDPRARSDQIHFHVRWLKNIGTIVAPVEAGVCGACWASPGTFTPVFFPFLDVPSDKHVGFVAYAICNRARCKYVKAC
jgi:hypothetical protein